MRKASLALALSTIMLAGGCAVSGTEKLLEAERTVDFDVACRDRLVTLNHQANSSINVHPPYIEVCRGRTVTVQIVPPVNKMTAHSTSKPKPADPNRGDWRDQTSADGATILLMVPMNAVIGTTYSYGLEMEGIGSIDPMIRIIN